MNQGGVESREKEGMYERLHEVVMSFGSNEHPRRRSIEEAIEAMRLVMSECEASDIYETPEIHGCGEPYMNAVLSGQTGMELETLERLTKEYEAGAGRDAVARSAGRVPIDIDIVIWDGTVVRPKDYSQSFFRIGYKSVSLKVSAPHGCS